MDYKLPDVPQHMPACRVTIMNAGFYRAPKSAMLKGDKQGKFWGPALFALIEHPEYGLILFDTGYSTRYYDSTSKLPYSLMRLATPARIAPEDNAVSQLRKLGIHPEDIKTVILSHLHADHAGGIHDFPHSRIYVDRQEWEFGQQSKFKLLTNGYLKDLYRRIDRSALRLLDFDGDGVPYGPFPKSIDLFRDGSMVLVPLPGHSIGQFGMIVNVSNEEKYFLMADAAYFRRNYREGKGGSFIGRIAHYDVRRYEGWFSMLHALEQANPNMALIPSHDPEAYEQFVKSPAPSEAASASKRER
ncbi:N-acyl homoserine lactonase AttM [Paenibacillus sp. CECT 9249]|uniref:MBL fold metallo-hydrolase n=1 Tax=Paenibacillus sp. CECT 9249 TaxID=2845385 RepID=UPI001E4B125E|nr:MBL fold metallo-hydrolase [Paenibacillus sp. CECT 9249]CAH0118124.1 N-acyl homoserine lactonase AttM [Paenibacillus sp. CECT 9249]